MSQLTSPRDTRELLGKFTYEREAAGTIYAGALVAQNADGKAVTASDAASLIVLGRAENSAVSGETVRIASGAYLYENGTSGEALTAADIGGVCFVVDDQTVGKVGGSHNVVAGVVLDVTDDGVAVQIPALLVVHPAVTHPKAAAVADCTLAGDTATSCETQLNALLAALRTAGLVTANA